MSKKNTFGKRLSLLLKALDLSQTEVSSLTGISRVSINRYLRCQSDMRASDFIQVLEVLGINLEEILCSRMGKASGGFPIKESATKVNIAKDIEYLLSNLDAQGRKSYLAYLLAHAEVLNPNIPRDISERLKASLL